LVGKTSPNGESLEERGHLLSLFFCLVFWRSAPHLQSAFYDSNNNKFLASRAHGLGFLGFLSSPKEKPPQLNSCEGLGFGF